MTVNFQEWQRVHDTITTMVGTYMNIIAETTCPLYQELSERISEFHTALRRHQLYIKLWWLPERLRWPVAKAWPKRWLPKLNVGEVSNEQERQEHKGHKAGSRQGPEVGLGMPRS